MRVGIIAGVLSGVFWGTVFLAPAMLHDFSPLFISIARYVLYGIISIIVIIPIAKKIIPRITGQRFLILVKLVIAGNIIYFILVSQAIQLIGIAPTSLIVGLVPVTAALFARKHSGLSLKTLAGPLVMIITGLLCINTDVFNHLTGVSFYDKVLGLACAFGALASWSWYAIDNAKYLQVNKEFSSNEWSLLFGVVTGMVAVILGLILMALPFEFIPVDKSYGEMRLFFFVVLGLAFFPSFLGNLCWNTASQRLPISLTSQMIVFETMFALLYGFIYAQRLPRTLEVLAIFLLIGGVVWSVHKHR